MKKLLRERSCIMNEDKVYPVSEIFTNFQGEGKYSGACMFFIRLSGCTVGKPYPKEMYESTETKTVGPGLMTTNALPVYTEQCHTWDGRGFPCDTDYRVKERLNVKDIFSRMPTGVCHVCISGGEPLIHNLNPIVSYAQDKRDAMVHIETSGTIPIGRALPPIGDKDKNPWEEDIWVTVSPKLGLLPKMVQRADELKLLIDKTFDESTLTKEILEHKLIYIQPVNNERSIRADNLKLVLELQKQHPDWRLSLQMHKAAEMVLHERVL